MVTVFGRSIKETCYNADHVKSDNHNESRGIAAAGVKEVSGERGGNRRANRNNGEESTEKTAIYFAP